MQMFEARVIPICGDLGQPNLGLTQDVWDFLANEMDTVFHNGATVNYLFNYDRMRDANVMGTNEVLRLAFEGRPKELQLRLDDLRVWLGGQERPVGDRLQPGHGASRFRLQPVQMGSGTGGCRRARQGTVRADLPARSRESLRYGRRQQLRYRRSPGCVHGESRHWSRCSEPG